MIILEWLTTYLETPKMDMTTEIEMLGLVAISIIAFAILGTFFGVWAVCAKITEIKEKKKRKNKEDEHEER